MARTAEQIRAEVMKEIEARRADDHALSEAARKRGESMTDEEWEAFLEKERKAVAEHDAVRKRYVESGIVMGSYDYPEEIRDFQARLKGRRGL